MQALVLSERLKTRCVELWTDNYESNPEFDSLVASQIRKGRSPTLVLEDLNERETETVRTLGPILRPYQVLW